ncbi:hypothetical protein V8G54_037592 [Vigna mungo]|uniref:50S ribosomal protein L17, chloroplastic n=1 Tax=Vigna mungo TaxID=3915 RepID=A0AAQ3MJV0_VIGMU
MVKPLSVCFHKSHELLYLRPKPYMKETNKPFFIFPRLKFDNLNPTARPRYDIARSMFDTTRQGLIKLELDLIQFDQAEPWSMRRFCGECTAIKLPLLGFSFFCENDKIQEAGSTHRSPDVHAQLVKHERIETTVAKAKEIRRLADNMVQLGKEGSQCAARRAASFVRGDDVLHKLFTELAYRYKDRAGGYTRLLRTRIRVGDAAPMAYIDVYLLIVLAVACLPYGIVIVQSFKSSKVLKNYEAKPPTPQPPQRAPLDPWTRSRLSRQFAPPKEEKSGSDL